jgi:predicted Zn-dependent protease
VGHEIGHVKAKHSAQRMEAAKKAQGKSILYGAIGGLLGGAAGYGLGKALCKEEDRACLLRASALGAAAGAGGGLLIQKFAFMANSREDEMEADRIGYKVAVQSGFDRGHAGTFYEKLLKMEESHQQNRTVIVSSVTDALATHPPSRERVAQIQQLSQQIPNRPGARVSSKEFERVKKIASQWVATRKKSS